MAVRSSRAAALTIVGAVHDGWAAFRGGLDVV
jgi:hypothetical protein